MSDFQELKIVIMETTGLAKDALHIYVSLIVFLLACYVFRWRAWSFKPLFIVLLAAITGEVLDVRDSLRLGYPIIFDNHWKDLWNTMLVPTIIVIAVRWTPVFEPKDELDPIPESGIAD